MKAYSRITRTEFWAVVHNRVGKGTLSATRDAAVLSAGWSTIARTGDIRQVQFRDVGHCRFSVGTKYDVYRSLRNEDEERRDSDLF